MILFSDIKNKFDEIDDSDLAVAWLDSFGAVGGYTHSNFYNENAGFVTKVEAQILNGDLFIDDTDDNFIEGQIVEINNTAFDDGLHIIKSIDDGRIEFEKPLLGRGDVRVSIVGINHDVRLFNAFELLIAYGLESDGIAVKSESLIDSSIEYGDGAAMTAQGYPVSIMQKFNAYRKMAGAEDALRGSIFDLPSW